uniref:Uncharacterized protein n=1 Tax=Anguilla anguilla TaxID=7936 RepID=A0A0E9QJS2_ANGAN
MSVLRSDLCNGPL